MLVTRQNDSFQTEHTYGLKRVDASFVQRAQGIDIPLEPGSRVNIIFVHGLGGSARETWTHPNTKQFWPAWLLRLETMTNVEVYTFGYEANWKNILGPRNCLGIQGFARQLLDGLDLHYQHNGDV